MNHWVFKATPRADDGSGYDYARELSVGREENWDSVKASELMRVGDRVFFWASSPLRHIAGLGVITRIHSNAGVRVRYLTTLLVFCRINNYTYNKRRALLRGWGQKHECN